MVWKTDMVLAGIWSRCSSRLWTSEFSSDLESVSGVYISLWILAYILVWILA